MEFWSWITKRVGNLGQVPHGVHRWRGCIFAVFSHMKMQLSESPQNFDNCYYLMKIQVCLLTAGIMIFFYWYFWIPCPGIIVDIVLLEGTPKFLTFSLTTLMDDTWVYLVYSKFSRRVTSYFKYIHITLMQC